MNKYLNPEGNHTIVNTMKKDKRIKNYYDIENTFHIDKTYNQVPNYPQTKYKCVDKLDRLQQRIQNALGRNNQ